MSESDDLLPLWLRNARNQAMAKSRQAANAFDALKNKDSKYAIGIATMRDLHAKCADIFTKSLQPLEKE